MEEDAAVKAPVTRLRRRLSVEQSEESKSPAMNTPTKRRGRKKPELELIDENTQENTTTRKAKKTAIKDIIDPVEEKPVTPSRRSTRIKSNTSIVSETAMAVGSPRAKRATRRASQVGSDNEAPVTPARTTRRTRKDSASSVEKLDQPTAKLPKQIAEVIVEEPETTSKRSLKSEKANEQQKIHDGSRKSPRLMKKQNQSFEKSEDPVTDKLNSSLEVLISEHNEDEKQTSELKDPDVDNNKREDQIIKKNRLSISSSNLIKDLNTEGRSKKNKINLNKSTPLVVLQNDAKTTRNRTKSWTTVSKANKTVFLSDNESTKNKVKSSFRLNHSVSEDIQNISLNKNKSKRKNSSNSFVEENVNKSLNVENNKSKNKSVLETDILNQSNSQGGKENINGSISSLFEKEPSGNIKTLVVIEDSDSNSTKANVPDTSDSGDQCVPVVEHPETRLELNQFTMIPDNNIILNKSKNRTITNNSCEPMDVDETMPDSLVIAETETTDKDSKTKSSISHKNELNISYNENLNDSKNKFSLSQNKSINEKSTPIVSHLKDTSFGSPNVVNKLLSKSAVDFDITQENGSNKKNISLNYLTSTPVHQKSIQKLVMQVNTSVIASSNDNKHGFGSLENTPKIQDKSDLSDKENNSVSKVSEKMDISFARKSITEKSNKVQQNKISFSKEQKNESERSDEDMPMKNPNKLKAKQETNESEESDEDILMKKSNKLKTSKETNESEGSDEDIPMKNPNKLKAKEETSESEESDEDIPVKKSNKLKAKPINKISSISSDDSNEESNMSDNDSRKSNILDDEAEDMGDDYESGDSRDESEKRFEKENEILEKGETLTSENDFSNDSDYEKGSFIVSSDEEDNELLEGTEDDLSMSDNELKMTSKSKKKYDERKLKEQKMASREMYESRHKINQKSEKVKKNNRQKLSSSESESSESEKDPEKPKKKNRMRLDSSHEASLAQDDCARNISKKNTSGLSESVVCGDTANEKEITIVNESINEKDPLSQIKEEPKTPIKSANSTIAFVNSEDINNDKNETTQTQTELMDPLEDSMDDDVSLCSENEELMQNYDSILNDLNKSNKTKTKTCDISLNLNKKSKKKEKTAIVEELNLTQVKSKKIKPKPDEKVIKVQKEDKVSKDGGDSSDSIDIHLLFSEDSNDSENKKEKTITEDNFIPLKRTEAKSNILQDEDVNLSQNRSAKKNKKRTSQIDKITSSDTTEDNNLSFFIDTEGTHNDTINKSHNKSLKNNLSITNTNCDDSEETLTQELSIHKQKPQDEDLRSNKSLNRSVTKTPGSAKKKVADKIIEKSVADNSDSDSPTEVSFKKEKRESKILDNYEVEKDETGFVLNKSPAKTPASKRKKKIDKNDLKDTEVVNVSANVSLIKTPKSGRKTLDKDIEEIENADNVTFIEKSFNKSICKTPASEKKKKKSLSHENDEELDTEVVNVSANVSLIKTPKSGRKTLDKDIEEIENADNVTFIEKSFNKSICKTPASEKKKKKSLSHENDEELGQESTEIVLNTSIDTKKKRISSNQNKSLHEESIKEVSNISLIKTPNSNKKNKLLKSHLEDNNDFNPHIPLCEPMTLNTDIKKKISITQINEVEEVLVEPLLNVSKIKTPSSQKKTVLEQGYLENTDTNSMKRKRKSSGGAASEVTVAAGGQVNLLNESLVINQKKKRKISEQKTEVTNDKESNRNENQIESIEQSVNIPKRQKSKKRKERDDDEGNSVSKVSKQNSYEQAPVPRLPTSLLKQLDDKPQIKNLQPKAKKPKLISTTEFIVEETKKRKAKPSNYLEESVYLDDDECESKKPKGRIINPKVLPFVPTASISNSGYTTNFKVNIVPKETKFVAQSNSIGNFKDDYLYNKKIKRQGTYELYKRNRNLKISKF